MAIESENRHHIGVTVATDGTIISRTALVSTVVREGVGSYLLTMLEGVGDAEEVHSLQIATDFSSESAEGGQAAVERVSATQYRIRTFDDAGVAGDQRWFFNIHKISNSNGL